MSNKYDFFTEIKVVHVEDSKSPYDVVVNNEYPIKNFEGKYDYGLTTVALQNRMLKLKYSEYRKWIEYQMEIREDKLLFLDELEGFVIDFNESFYNKLKPDLPQHFRDIIAEIRADFTRDMSANVTISREEYDRLIQQAKDNELPFLIWKANGKNEERGRDVALLELILALSQTGKIYNDKNMPARVELVAAFEKIFRVDLNDQYQKVHQIVDRSNPTKFIDSLKLSLEQYVREKKKKNNEGMLQKK